jgi:hypothetical protein
MMYQFCGTYLASNTRFPHKKTPGHLFGRLFRPKKGMSYLALRCNSAPGHLFQGGKLCERPKSCAQGGIYYLGGI